ncbi:hypothetical protein BLD44_020230 [Mastigocladus laminosus UU774]|nr:hypothetical protein BLD44_020230 [Mastigocladus laminosus UU774]
MSNSELHNYLAGLPEVVLQEFTQWCVLEQATAAGYEFTPDLVKLKNLETVDYIHELVGQFADATRKSIEGSMAIMVAGKQADNHALPGIAAIVDFISLYVKYLVPKGPKNELPTDEKLNLASQEQFEQLCQIAKKHSVEILM